MSSADDQVSIHALVRVRLFNPADAPGIMRFNPRTRESATYGTCYNVSKLTVSIHALVRVRPG